jgi:hypothetical protein
VKDLHTSQKYTACVAVHHHFLTLAKNQTCSLITSGLWKQSSNINLKCKSANTQTTNWHDTVRVLWKWRNHVLHLLEACKGSFCCLITMACHFLLPLCCTHMGSWLGGLFMRDKWADMRW